MDQNVDLPSAASFHMDWLRGENEHTGVRLIECKEAMTGEDFGFFLERIPGFMFWLGADTPYCFSHARIEPSEDAIGVAIESVSRYLRWKPA